MVDPVERVEVLDPARVGDGDERVELPVVLHRQRDPLLVRERPEDVGGDRAAEVGVQLGETLGDAFARLYPARCARRHRPRPARGTARLRDRRAPVLRRAARPRGAREARVAAGAGRRLVPRRVAAAPRRRRARVRAGTEGASGFRGLPLRRARRAARRRRR